MSARITPCDIGQIFRATLCLPHSGSTIMERHKERLKEWFGLKSPTVLLIQVQAVHITKALTSLPISRTVA